jgi:RHS repeat-associated protein
MTRTNTIAGFFFVLFFGAHLVASANQQLDDRSSESNRTNAVALKLPTGEIAHLGGVYPDGTFASKVEIQGPSGARSFGPQLALRTGHTATLLLDGRVLILGGAGPDGYLVREVEIWDPQTQDVERFEIKSELARINHSAILLPSGHVQITGGLDRYSQPISLGAVLAPNQREFVPLGPAQLNENLSASVATMSIPADGALSVELNRWVGVLFSRSLNVLSASPDSIVLLGPEGAVPVQILVAENGLLLFARPLQELVPNSEYSLVLSGLSTTSGEAVVPSAITFYTRAIPTVNGTLQARPNNQQAMQAGGQRFGPVSGSTVGHPVASSSQDAMTRQGHSSSKYNEKLGIRDVDDEEWIPGERQLRGDWTSGRGQVPKRKASGLRAESSATSLAGQVLRLNGRPLAGVTLRAGAASTVSDEDGEFLLVGLTPGEQRLEIDGTTANREGASYGYFESRVAIEPGKKNELPWTIWMSKLDTSNEVEIPSPTTSEVVLTTPRIPGFEVRIPKGVVIRGRDGNIVTRIGITAIPTDQTPFPIPEMGFTLYYTVQPGGAVIASVDGQGAKPAQLVYPNYSRALPNTAAKFYLFDPTEEGWFVYGKGAVNPDGKSISGGVDFGLYQFTGGGVDFSPDDRPEGPPPCGPGTCCVPGDLPGKNQGGSGGWGGTPGSGGENDPGCGTAGDPVILTTGAFLHVERDLYVPDVVPLDVTRIYSSDDSRTGPFGKGTTSPWDPFLRGQLAGTISLVLANGTTILFHCLPYPGDSACSTNITPGTAKPPRHRATVSKGAYFNAELNFIASATTTEVHRGVDIAVKGFELRLRDGSLYKFWPHGGKLSWYQDRFGNRTVIKRTQGETGHVQKLISPNGLEVNFTHSGNLVTSANDGLGRSFTYEYNSNGALEKVTAPSGGGVRRYEYDASGRLAKVYDPEAYKRKFVDGDQNASPMVTNVYFTSADFGGSTSEPRIGMTKQQVFADGGTVSFNYVMAATGQTATPWKVSQADVTDQRGKIRRVDFNPQTREVFRSTFPFGLADAQVTTFSRNAGGYLELVTDPLGRSVKYEYASNGKPQYVTMMHGTSSAATWHITYEPNFDQPESITNPLGHSWKFTYDAKGLLRLVTDPLGNQTRATYTASGQIESVTNPLGQTAKIEYWKGRPVRQIDPLGRISTFEYDAQLRLNKMIDPLGRIQETTYDLLNRAIEVKNPLGHVVQFDYNLNGALIRHRDQRNNQTSYAPDSMGRGALRTDALNQTEEWRYDIPLGGGRPTRHTDRKAQVTGVAYDHANRVASLGFGASIAAPSAFQNSISVEYDKLNRTTRLTDSQSGVITYEYDDLTGQLKKETTPQGVVEYSYDLAGRRKTLSVSGQTQVQYGWYDNGQIKSITQGAHNITFEYDAAGRRTKTVLANGMSMEYGYDSASQLKSITYKQGLNITGTLLYGYNDAGERTAVTGSLGHIQLAALTTAPGVFDAMNRLTNWNGQAYAYDANGNLTSDGTRTYTWDARNQLTQIAGPVPTSFQYDAFGRRIQKTVASSTTGFVFDGGNFVQEKANAQPGASITANLLTGGIDELFQRTVSQSGATSFYLTDALGSPARATDSAGGTLTSYFYEPYGATTRAGAAQGAQGFTGREDDGTGLFYYRARYYLPGCGRFISEDPIGLASGDANFYSYVGGRPMELTDPSGLKPGDSFCTVDAAALDAIRYINPKSIAEGREYGGWIYRKWNGSYSYDEPKRGEERSLVMPRRPFFNRTVADYHTHGAAKPGFTGYELFSSDDKDTNEQLGITGYLGTPSGKIKRYEPVLGKPQRGMEQNLTYGGGGSGCNY